VKAGVNSYFIALKKQEWEGLQPCRHHGKWLLGLLPPATSAHCDWDSSGVSNMDLSNARLFWINPVKNLLYQSPSLSLLPVLL